MVYISSTSAVPEESDPKPLRAPAKPEAPEAWREGGQPMENPWEMDGSLLGKRRVFAGR